VGHTGGAGILVPTLGWEQEEEQQEQQQQEEEEEQEEQEEGAVAMQLTWR
jgi:hypothetical protein